MGPATKKLIEEWGEDLLADVLAALSDKNHIASGRLYLSLRTEVKESLDEIQFLIYEEDYGKYLDSGRPQGKQPPFEKIEAWCRSKGIPERAAYPIARRIGRIGTRPTNYFKIPLDIRLALLEQDVQESMKLDLIERIREMVTKINEK
jgi:hypothetical protein